ncbi:MAG: NUDIX hydrolase [Acidobacteria bacterium]|nr:NUDIX hydrolase [Acidobacteriota bacterium]
MNETRQYPARPIVGVGAVIVDDGKVVLVKRRYEPLAGRWSLPGGTLEVGETLKAAVIREMREETGLDVEVGPLLEVFDRITTDEAQRVQYHFVLVDYLCWPVRGLLQASSDVEEAVLAGPESFAEYNLTENAEAVITKALALNQQLGSRR